MSTPFRAIAALHTHLTEQWATDEGVSPEQIRTLLSMSYASSQKIANATERERLRSILRLWASRLLRLGEPFPDIDIDSQDRRPHTIEFDTPTLATPPSPSGSLRGVSRLVETARKTRTSQAYG